MQRRRLQFSMRALLITMLLIGAVSGFTARAIHRQLIAQRPLVFKELTRQNLSQLASHHRAMIVWGADWDMTSSVQMRRLVADQPDVRLAVHDFGCTCFYIDLSDDAFFQEFMDRYPSLQQNAGSVLWLERGQERKYTQFQRDNCSLSRIMQALFQSN